jgi:hypothetical protein
LLFLARCKDPEPEPPETPPVIIVSGQNPLKTGIYLPFVDDSVRIIAPYGIDSVRMEHDIDSIPTLLGYHQIFYYVQSLSGMTAEAQRDVWVVVKPESMKGAWEVSLDTSLNLFTDSLTVANKKLFINNLHNIPELKIELSLAADLQDSVYIFDQYNADSTYRVYGFGTIDSCAMNMSLTYFLTHNNAVIHYNATYSRDSISIK